MLCVGNVLRTQNTSEKNMALLAVRLCLHCTGDLRVHMENFIAYEGTQGCKTRCMKALLNTNPYTTHRVCIRAAHVPTPAHKLLLDQMYQLRGAQDVPTELVSVLCIKHQRKGKS